MKAKASVEISFEKEEHAEKAAKILRTDEFSDRVSTSFYAKGKVLRVKAEAKNFAALRARLTSLFRDVKVVFDSIALAEKGEKNRR